jgi:hypothetical protein
MLEHKNLAQKKKKKNELHYLTVRKTLELSQKKKKKKSIFEAQEHKSNSLKSSKLQKPFIECSTISSGS